MRKLCVFMLSVIMMFSMTACGSGKAAETTAAETTVAETTVTETTAAETTEEETEELVGMPNPWSDCENLADAEAVAGFTYNFREVIAAGSYYAKEYRAMDGMLEITYYPEESCDASEVYTIRQAKLTTEDISGDYNVYSHDFIDGDAGVDEVRLRGSKDTLAICSFNYGDYSYVIYPGTGSYNETFAVIGEMTGVDPTLYVDTPVDEEEESVAEEEEEVAEEGAPYIQDGRLVDEAPIDVLEIAGRYSGIIYGDLELNIYTSPEGNVVGNFTMYDQDGNTEFMGELCEIMTNYYGMTDSDATFTVYSDNGNYGLDFYYEGEHADYFIMTEHFES